MTESQRAKVNAILSDMEYLAVVLQRAYERLIVDAEQLRESLKVPPNIEARGNEQKRP